MELVTEVKPLFEKTSKWDVVVKGVTIKLKLDPCQCGVHAMWVTEVPARDMLPPQLRALPIEILSDSETVQKIVDEWHYELKWYEKWMWWRTLDRELAKWIKQTHARWEQLVVLEAKAQALKIRMENI